MGSKLDASRIKTIYSRQKNRPWDETYLPSIMATREEAPSASIPGEVKSEKFNRKIQCLSYPEFNFALLALYHPKVVGIQEQRMLSPVSNIHPLWGFPGVDKVSLTNIKGTIEVAAEMGYGNFHKSIGITNRKSETIFVAVPLIGDFLLAIKSSDGVYCVNWSIKSQEWQFEDKLLYQFNSFNRRKSQRESQLNRHLVEVKHYESCGIPTHSLHEGLVDINVFDNLRKIHNNCRGYLSITSSQHEELLDQFKAAFDCNIPPSEVIRKFHIREKYTPDESMAVLYRSIWQRQIRIDLYSPFLIDHPIKPEKTDALEDFAKYFGSGI